MTFAFAFLVLGGLLLNAGITRRSLGDVIQGNPGPDDPQTPGDDPALQALLVGTSGTGGGTGDVVSGAGDVAADVIGTANGAWGGSKAVVDVAVQIGRRNHLRVISTKRATKNTASGGVSDHWVGNRNAYAADQSNGSSPTPQMDATAREIARTFGLSWSGSGVTSKIITVGAKRFRVQMLYRTMVGGNHFNHVHFGAKLVG